MPGGRSAVSRVLGHQPAPCSYRRRLYPQHRSVEEHLGSLYLVGTPIGNLGDITLRALDVLRQVSLVAAEDTRTTRKLLSHFDIHVPLVSYYEHNRLQRLEQILTTLASGDVALVSDSGTPSISDPGYHLVRAAIDSGVPVVPIPGPNAAIAALAASGLPTDSFIFAGFLPRQESRRREALERLAWQPQTIVLYEAPHRIEACLADLLAGLGNRQIAVARELTKMHEEFWRGTLSDAAKHFTGPQRGEFTLVVEGRAERTWSRAEVVSALAAIRAQGVGPAEAARSVAAEAGWPRAEVYRLGLTASTDGNDPATSSPWEASDEP